MSTAQVVTFDAPADPIRQSPGFAKKKLSEWKLDIMGLCQFGCRYCSSNNGNFLRIRRQPFADETEKQLGERLMPTENPELTFEWSGIADRVREQLKRRQPRGRLPAMQSEKWGHGETMVFSMLTDGFSPRLVKAGITEEVLSDVISMSGFRVRILTKNAIVGSPKWIDMFKFWGDRVIVGLSIGTLDNEWAKKIEVGTSSPRARLRALHKLQDAGVPTYGMLCPVFPDVVMSSTGVEDLVDAVRPERCTEIFAEPYNDRTNWRTVADGYEDGSKGRRWLEECYGTKQGRMWSAYAARLYQRISRRLEHHDVSTDQLRYLLYEVGTQGQAGVMGDHVDALGDLGGILFQSAPREDGLSKNPAIADLQAKRS